MSTLALEAQNVTQSFAAGFWGKQKQILFDVNLKVEERSIFGFLGANGAGKTTLIHLIVGIKRPRAGSVKVFGHAADTREAKARLGYLPERPYFYEHLTGEEFLRAFGILSGMTDVKVRDRIPTVLAQVGLERGRHLELARYSKGMLQRIGIAQAILHEPELLVLDEPMSGLDPVGRKEIRELLLDLARKGHTLFFSSHVIPDVEAICTEIAYIEKGELLTQSRIGSLLSINMANVRAEIAFHGPSRAEIDRHPVLRALEELMPIPDGAFRGYSPTQTATQATLRALLEMNARVLWVQPVRPSLENLFLESGRSS